jgi:hypothetical protein
MRTDPVCLKDLWTSRSSRAGWALDAVELVRSRTESPRSGIRIDRPADGLFVGIGACHGGPG